MMRIIFAVIIFFVVITIGPAILKQLFQLLTTFNPIGWAMKAGKATSDEAVEADVQCLKNTAKQYGLDSQANAACGTKKGTDYITCMKEFFLTNEDALSAAMKAGTNGTPKDFAVACAGTTTQTTIKDAGENFAWAKFCSKFPKWVPGFFKKWIQCPGA
jgi:hypothetical protein